MTAKVTPNTYVEIAAYDLANGNGYNDHIVGIDGCLHAQGSHDLMLHAHPQVEKARWHDIQRQRRHQHHEATKRSRHETTTSRHTYVKVGPRTWALNALVDDRTGEVIKCDGYTSHNPRKSRRCQSKLGRLCHR